MIPPSVFQYTDDYKKLADSALSFINERYESNPKGKIQTQTFYDDFCLWCIEKEVKPLGIIEFSKDCERIGIEKTTIKGRNYWKGIKTRG